MAPSPLDPPDAGRPTPGYAALDRDYPPPPPEPEPRRHPIVRHIVLFVLTLRDDDAHRRGALLRLPVRISPRPRRPTGLDGVPERPLVQPGHSGHSGRARVRPLPGVPLLRRGCVAALLHSGAAPDGNAGRVHPHPAADSRQAAALRHRHRRADRGLPGGRPGADSRHQPVARGADPDRASAGWSWASRCCCKADRVRLLGHDARTASR